MRGYDLVINRTAALAGPASWDVSIPAEESIYPAAHRLGTALLASAAYNEAEESILSVLRRADAKSVRTDAKGIDKVWERDMEGVPPNSPVHVAPFIPIYINRELGNDYILVQLPSSRFCVNLGGTGWILRARASFSACPLWERGGIAKLFWALEGIPQNADYDHRPTAQQAAGFLKLTSGIEKKTMPLLHKAYESALAEVTGVSGQLLLDPFSLPLAPTRLQVRLADSQDVATGELVDAVRYRGMKLSDIRKMTKNSYDTQPWAKKGLAGLDRFTKAVTASRLRATDETFKVITPKNTVLEGALCETGKPQRGYHHIVGLVHAPTRMSMYNNAATMCDDMKEARLRQASAARQLSGMLVRESAFLFPARPEAKVRRRGRPPAQPAAAASL